MSSLSPKLDIVATCQIRFCPKLRPTAFPSNMFFARRRLIIPQVVDWQSSTGTTSQFNRLNHVSSHHRRSSFRFCGSRRAIHSLWSSTSTVHLIDHSPHFTMNFRTSFPPSPRRHLIISSYVVIWTRRDLTPSPSAQDSVTWLRHLDWNNTWGLLHGPVRITSSILLLRTNHPSSEMCVSSTRVWFQTTSSFSRHSTSNHPDHRGVRSSSHNDLSKTLTRLILNPDFVSLPCISRSPNKSPAGDAESVYAFAEQIERVVTSTLDEVAPIRTRLSVCIRSVYAIVCQELQQ